MPQALPCIFTEVHVVVIFQIYPLYSQLGNLLIGVISNIVNVDQSTLENGEQDNKTSTR